MRVVAGVFDVTQAASSQSFVSVFGRRGGSLGNSQLLVVVVPQVKKVPPRIAADKFGGVCFACQVGEVPGSFALHTPPREWGREPPRRPSLSTSPPVTFSSWCDAPELGEW